MEKFDVNKAVLEYLDNGFTVVDFFTNEEKQTLDNFALQWIYSILPKSAKKLEISQYHNWFKELNINHEALLVSKNRHKKSNSFIKDTIINNPNLKEFCKLLGINKYEFWNEGLGDIGFRLIRPDFADGYPLSKKEWGIAKNVISLWIPIEGYSENETLLLLPKSHKKEFQGDLDTSNKFRSDEQRLTKIDKTMEFIRPRLRKNEIIIFHPKLIHSEDVENSKITRFNLEMRLNPKYE